jgi:hypothetical protein
LLFIIAGLVRLQVAWLTIILFSPLVITLLNRRQVLRAIVLTGFVVVVLFFLNMIHRNYYSKHIDGWKEQEKFRQGMFYVYNRQLNDVPMSAFRDTVERDLYNAGFLYDSSIFSPDRVNEIAKKITRKRSFGNKEDRVGLYWLFIELRLYLVLFGILLVSLIVNRQYTVLKKWMLSLLLVLLLNIYLFVFLKITLVLHLGILMTLLLHLALHLKRDQPLFIQKKMSGLITGFVVVLLAAWMVVRLEKENRVNINKRERFYCLMTELNRDPEKLFVGTGFDSPIDHFYIWDNPQDYPARNILFKERLLTRTYLYTLDRYGVKNLREALSTGPDVYMWGKPLPALFRGYPEQVFVQKVEGYNCLEVYQLSK